MKKRNQKIVALLLVMTTVLSMSSPVFAADDENDHSGTDWCDDDYPSSNIGVYGNYVDSLDATKILSVDVAWTSMNFRYAAQQQGTWQPDSHTYEGATTEAGWVNDSATITVNNHSNMAVTASLSYTPGTVTTVTGDFGKKTMELETAEDTDKDNPPTDSTTFTVDGRLSEGDTDLGTITVTVEDSEKYFDGLDLSGVDSSQWEAQLATYFAQKDPKKTGMELKVKLGKETVASTEASTLNDAVESYYKDGEYSSNWGGMVELTIQDATTIADKAFQFKAFGFHTINLPNVATIGEEAFFGNAKIQKFNLPKCTSIGDSAFAYCGACTEVVFESNIEYASGKEFGDTPDGSLNNVYGYATNTANITLTIGSTQGDTKPGASGVYETKIGTPGEFMCQTFKEVKRAN